MKTHSGRFLTTGEKRAKHEQNSCCESNEEFIERAHAPQETLKFIIIKFLYLFFTFIIK